MVQTLLLPTPNVHLHNTPTYSSSLNQVKIWFAKVQSDVIARGISPGTKDLDKKIMRYICEHNKRSKPIRCKYANSKYRIASNLIDSVN